MGGIAKREEVIDVFRKRKNDLLALTETKLSENWEVSCCEINRIIAEAQEIEKAREGMAVLMNDEWHIAVIGFGCVSFRVLWVKFKFSRVKVCMVGVYVLNEI